MQRYLDSGNYKKSAYYDQTYSGEVDANSSQIRDNPNASNFLAKAALSMNGVWSARASISFNTYAVCGSKAFATVAWTVSTTGQYNRWQANQYTMNYKVHYLGENTDAGVLGGLQTHIAVLDKIYGAGQTYLTGKYS